MTLYDVLQVSEDASPEVIQAAYTVMRNKYDPSRYPNATPEQIEKLRKRTESLNAVYDVLSDPEKRSQYDSRLLNSPTTQAQPMWEALCSGECAVVEDFSDDKLKLTTREKFIVFALTVLFLVVLIVDYFGVSFLTMCLC